MKNSVMATLAGALLAGGVYADDPTPAPSATPAPAAAPTPAPTATPPTHVVTTVVGSSIMGLPGDAAPPTLDNSHDFVAGAPDLLRIAKRLNLSAKQQSQLHQAIENSDAGAAVLIGREHDVKQMIAATTPTDPAYPKLIADQAAEAARWTENRENLRRSVLALLTPAQQKRFLELQASSTQTPTAAE